MAQPSTNSAPQWQVDRWFNSEQALSLDHFRGRVVALHAFQMLCPGCVQHGLPQAQRIASLFDSSKVAVVGLHTVFEHHEVMTSAALAVFIQEYRLTFPIGVDRPSPDGPLPMTMASYGMQGTPTLVLIDRRGRLRTHFFGVESDIRVGADIGLLLAEDER